MLWITDRVNRKGKLLSSGFENERPVLSNHSCDLFDSCEQRTSSRAMLSIKHIVVVSHFALHSGGFVSRPIFSLCLFKFCRDLDFTFGPSSNISIILQFEIKKKKYLIT